MSVAGTYVLTSNENYLEWLTALGVPAERVTRMVAVKPKVVVSVTGSEVVVKTEAGDKSFTNTINLGKDSKAELPGGIEYVVNLSLSGSKLEGTWNLGDKSGTALVEFTASGATQTVVLGDITAKRVYSRQ
ncbi:fatty acid binding protein 1-B.1 [Procambarus clarkii]|uniref:fatty acid binding protein 1-B.1 n=1 Tax=Procambarus clarkii TaxID=6728 RepID=UPI001E672719|nr:fatty acid-binding protein, brain-like [Procambarus clarkii]XP_045607491.1 fatty acid-binding protein, brain-like [Procambarus clarkii]